MQVYSSLYRSLIAPTHVIIHSRKSWKRPRNDDSFPRDDCISPICFFKKLVTLHRVLCTVGNLHHFYSDHHEKPRLGKRNLLLKRQVTTPLFELWGQYAARGVSIVTDFWGPKPRWPFLDLTSKRLRVWRIGIVRVRFSASLLTKEPRNVISILYIFDIT